MFLRSHSNSTAEIGLELEIMIFSSQVFMTRMLASYGNSCLKTCSEPMPKSSVSNAFGEDSAGLICLQHTLECYTCSLDFQVLFKKSQDKRFGLMSYCTCNEKRITIHVQDAHMLDEHIVSRLLTWHLTTHPVNDSIKIFTKCKPISFGMCVVREGYNLFLELQQLRNRIRRWSQNTVTHYSS